jgi:hypothetical protein
MKLESYEGHFLRTVCVAISLRSTTIVSMPVPVILLTYIKGVKYDRCKEKYTKYLVLVITPNINGYFSSPPRECVFFYCRDRCFNPAK